MIMSRNEVWNRITGRIVLDTSTRTVLVKVYLRRSSILREFCGMGVAKPRLSIRHASCGKKDSGMSVDRHRRKCFE